MAGRWCVCVVLLLPGFTAQVSAQGSQFFAEDPVPYYDDAYLYGVFMQHVETSHSSGYLHKGIDVAADPPSAVFSANVDAEASVPSAQVVHVGADEHRLMVAKCGGEEQEALLFGHVEPCEDLLGILPEDFPFLDSSELIARVQGGKNHVHAELYKGLPVDWVWDGLVPRDYGIDVDSGALRAYLVNPATNAFEEAPWIPDGKKPTITSCTAYRVSNCHWWPWTDCYRIVVRAYDTNDELEAVGSDCKPGVYRIELYADGALVDDLGFEDWHGDASDIYLNPDLPPTDNCNESNGLYYFLEWDHYDLEDHDFSVVVYDAAGNRAEYDHIGTVVPQVRVASEIDGERVRVTWRIPKDSSLRDVSVFRSEDAHTAGLRLSPHPVPGEDENGVPIEDFVFVDQVPTYWDTLWYTLTAVVSGEERVIGRTWVMNPRAGELLVRAWPNPFNPVVQIELYNPKEGWVEVGLYDVQGRRVKEVLARELPRGPARFSWDGRTDKEGRASPGVYFLTVRSPHSQTTEKLVLVE